MSWPAAAVFIVALVTVAFILWIVMTAEDE